MATIGKLVVSLSANSAKLVSELQRSKKKADSWAKDIAKRAKTTAKVFAGMGIAVAGAFAGIVVAVNKTAAEIDKLAKTADKLGVGTTELQRLRYQAELSGVGVQTLDMALQRMTRRVSEAAQGTGEAKDAIKELGLDARLLASLSPDQQFYAIADAMKEVTNQGDRVRLAMKLFDSEGVALVNTLGSNLKAVGEEFDSLGIGITRQQASMVEAYNDARSKLSTLFGGFGTKLTVMLAGPFQKIVGYITDTIQKMGGIDAAAKMAADGIIRAMAGIVEGAGSVVTAINEIKIGWKEIQLFDAKFRALQVKIADKMGVDVDTSVFAEVAKLETEIANLQTNNVNVDQTVARLNSLADDLRSSIGDDMGGAAGGINGLGTTAANATDPLNLLGSAAKGAAGALKGVEDWEARIKGEGSLFSKLFKDIDRQRPRVDNTEFNIRARAARRTFNGGNFSAEDAARMLGNLKAVVDGAAKNADVNFDIPGMRDVVQALKSQAEQRVGIDELTKALKARNEAPATIQFEGLGKSIDLHAENSKAMATQVEALVGSNKTNSEVVERAAKALERLHEISPSGEDGVATAVRKQTGVLTELTETLRDLPGGSSTTEKVTEKIVQKLADQPPTKFEITLTIDGKKRTFRGRSGDHIVDQISLERAATAE